jgi:NADH-quinone oxidoreductase subunit G
MSDHLIDRGILSEEDLQNKFVIVFATNHTDTTKAADLVIPITCIAEHAASYVNLNGRIQRSFPAKETKYTNRRLDLEMSEGRTDRYGTNFDNWRSEDNKIDCLPVWRFMTQVAEQSGLDLSLNSGREIMEEISELNEAFAGVSYPEMDDNGGIQLSVEGAKKTKA